MGDWRLIDSGAAPGGWNLALDDAIFRRVRERRSPPTLRFYTWSEPTLSLGYGQDPTGEIDLDACRSLHVPVLRRSTGGRAVLHDGEVTYSVAVPSGTVPFGSGLEAAYRAVAAGLVAGLRLLGVEAVAATPRGGRAGGRHPGCFAAVARHEIAVGGRKLVGSAQRRRDGAFLQHGSILLETHATRLARLLRPGAAAPAAGAMVGLAEVLDPCPPTPEIVRALAAGCAGSWGVRLLPERPDAGEVRLARELWESRYGGGIDASRPPLV